MTTAIPWDIDNLTIQHGKHDPPNGTVSTCAMEAAYLDLCPSGALLLRTAATETATACEHCGGSGYEPNDTGETAFDGDPCTKCRPLSATTPEIAP